MIGYALDYLALVARDVDSACRFLGGSLGLRRSELELGDRTVPFFGIGQSAVAVFDVEDPHL